MSLLNLLIQFNAENLKVILTVLSPFTSDTMAQPTVIFFLHNQRTILTDLSFKSFLYETFLFFSITKTDLLE